jgi:polysaccharide export outer membrane protein
MPLRVRGKLVIALWAVWALGGLGCAAQVSYSILGGQPTPDNPPAKNQPAIPGTDRRDNGAAGPEVFRAAKDSTDLPASPIPYMPPTVSALPESSPPGTGTTIKIDKVDGGTPPSVLPAVPPGGGTPAPTPPDRRPAVGPQGSPLPDVKMTAVPGVPDLPEFKAGAVKNVSDAKPSDPLLMPGPLQPRQPLAVSTAAPTPKPPLPAPAPAPVPSPCLNGNCGAGPYGPNPGERPLPTELAKVSHPPYMIEPPDILLLDAIRMVPRPPYTVQPLDILLVRVSNTLPNQPIDGAFVVAPDGTISLGFSYGAVRVAGMNLERVQEEIAKHLSRVLRNPDVSVGLGQFRGMQQLRGEHLVRQDGTISLGTYGCVYVTGMTIPQAKLAIERHLSQFLLEPEVSVDVFAYNSKVYYIIADGAGFGQQVFRFPITGNETVLDAISHIQGLPVVASPRHIWVARPVPANHECIQVLPVDWRAITQGGATNTNYQLFPGDRIYIRGDCLIWIDNTIAKIVSPIERLFGVTLLGETTVQSFRRNNFNNGGFFVP